jgi:hypothetical protein
MVMAPRVEPRAAVVKFDYSFVQVLWDGLRFETWVRALLSTPIQNLKRECTNQLCHDRRPWAYFTKLGRTIGSG